MIDIHHHLLFGLDDGSVDLETSVAMANAAAEDGITHIVCTPHASSHWAFQPEANRQKLAELQARVDERLTLGLGCDFHLSYGNIVDALEHPEKYSINGKSYLLVEFSEMSIPPAITSSFEELQKKGLTIILTHPERNRIIVSNPNRLVEWMRIGCLVQVTAASLYGRFGKAAEAFSNELLRRNWIHFLATDAHNLTSRPPILSQVFEYVADLQGLVNAERLCIRNPRAAFYGEPLPDQPDPEGLNEERIVFPSEPPASRKSFFQRLLSR